MKWVENHSATCTLIAAFVGAIGGWGLPVLYGSLANPPALSTAMGVMDGDIQAAMTNNLNARASLVKSIYAPDAVLFDAGCPNPISARTWSGIDRIVERYQGLPRFSALQHVNVEAVWMPANSRATRAEVTGETVGVIAATRTTPTQFIHAREVWLLVRPGSRWIFPDDRWVIKLFAFDLCLS